jgi:menaquinone-9 beta-reductase
VQASDAQAYDLVIIGGGPAGLSTALHVHAAAPHLRLVVLEAERYPRDKICAGGIGARAFRVLDKLGVAIDCPMVPLDAVALRFGAQTVVTREPGLGAVVRRFEFDHAFAKAAIARGIEIRDGCEVTTLDIEGDGVRIHAADGAGFMARAIVGADGVGGIVRRCAGFARGALRAQVVELDTEHVASDQPRDTVVFDFSASDLQGYAWDFPTLVAGRELVCRGVYVLHHLASDSPRTRVERYLSERGLDPSRYKLKRFAERGFEPGAELARPRVLLVGEAAGIDIASGEGIAQAIEYGAAAGPFLARAFERDDLRFAGWRGYVDRHHVGWQLRVRHMCYRWFYGERRGELERMLPRLDQLLHVGVQDFAGQRLSKLAIARGAGQLVAAWARERMREPS